MQGAHSFFKILFFLTIVTPSIHASENSNSQIVNQVETAGDILQVIKLEPRHFGALSGLGMIRVRAGDLQGALRAYQAAQRLNAHLPQIEMIINQLEQKVKGRAL